MAYNDATVAKNVCPFVASKCGGSNSFAFSQVGQSQNITITLKAGETCTYNVQADCGLPSLKPNDTTGFEIETVDYDDDDIADVPVTKAVQTAPVSYTHLTLPTKRIV